VKQQHALALADHRENLTRETGTLLAEVKHRYDLEAMKHSRFSEKLSEIAADVYVKLLGYKTKLSMYVLLPERDEEAREKAQSSQMAYGEAFYYKELVFPRDVAASIRELDDKFDRVWRLMFYVDQQGLTPRKDLQQWQEAQDIMKSQVPALFEKVFLQLRILIGASDSQSAPSPSGQ